MHKGLPRIPGIATGLAILVLALLAGCRTAPDSVDPPTPTPEPDPRLLLQKSADSLQGLSTLAFNLDHETGTTVLFPGLEMTRAYGVVEMPENSRLTVDAEAVLMGAYVEVHIITVDGQAFMTDFVSGEWQSVAPGTLPINLSAFSQTLADIFAAVQEPTWTGSVDLEGSEAHRVSGRVTSGNLSGLVPNAAPGFPVDLELWLDKPSGVLLRAKISGQVVSTDLPETVRLLSLSEFDSQVSISPPIKS